MKRVTRPGRRTRVYLDPMRLHAAVVWGQPRPFGRWDPWAVRRGFGAFDVTCYLKLPTIDRDPASEPTWQAERGRAVARLLTGDLVYAFYSHESNLVKIGRTADLRRRWTKLEHESGQLRQLVSVWHSPDSRELEHELHRRWLSHRRFGEWFAAAPVLDDLRHRYSAAPSPPMLLRPG